MTVKGKGQDDRADPEKPRPTRIRAELPIDKSKLVLRLRLSEFRLEVQRVEVVESSDF
jgi:hypothetical protein